MTKEGRRRVHVTLGGDPEAGRSVEDLAAAGLEVEERLDAIGVVTGWADDETLERLRSIDGVTVEAERGVQLPPPDAPVQ